MVNWELTQPHPARSSPFVWNPEWAAPLSPYVPKAINMLRWPQDMDITSLWDLPWHVFDFSLCWCHLDFLAACQTCPFSTYLSALWQKLPMALWLILSLIPFLSLTQCHFSEGLSLTTQSPEVPSSLCFDHCTVLDSPHPPLLHHKGHIICAFVCGWFFYYNISSMGQGCWVAECRCWSRVPHFVSTWHPC